MQKKDRIEVQLTETQYQLEYLQRQYAIQQKRAAEAYQALGYIHIDPQYELEDLLRKIKKLDEIIQSPEPPPRYRTDGLYCVNNIYLCKNHPPRQVLANEEEILQHRATVSHAMEEKGKLMLRKAALENYLSLYKEQQQFAHLIDEAEYTQRQLTQERGSAEHEVSIANHNLVTAESELQQLDKQYENVSTEPNQAQSAQRSRWEQLKQLALKEIKQEQLKLMAMQEIKIEQVGDKLIDEAIDGARRIGAITEQAKKNLHFIKDFGNRALGELKDKLNDFQHNDDSHPESSATFRQ